MLVDGVSIDGCRYIYPVAGLIADGQQDGGLKPFGIFGQKMYEYRRRTVQIGLLESAFARIADVQFQFTDHILDKRFATENFDFIIDILRRRYDTKVLKSAEVIAGIASFLIVLDNHGRTYVVHGSNGLQIEPGAYQTENNRGDEPGPPDDVFEKHSLPVGLFFFFFEQVVVYFFFHVRIF